MLRRHCVPGALASPDLLWVPDLVSSCLVTLSHVQLFATPWTAARQAPLSMGILQARILE